ncbi:MAG: antibiotic biosynthesis monooxygenase [Eudoraea sp.]|nr:antibiotic biosynthesis monooxygenase [Eudoraea sp.]MBT8322691.1 antibiotic biosynthesis monooxygenase [Eudoraea sp.]NNJ38434.1 antibiotic biosynthesis monooxygenase [Flavobacteriaceae bacterium]
MKISRPYYAVIFTSRLNPETDGYHDMAKKMEDLAKKQPGYLGFESAREKLGISISYWESLDAIDRWKSHAEHQFAQEMGIKQWYKWYKVRVCEVQREYDFSGK